MTTKEQVIDCARTWIDTPFHHQGRLKGVGVDCIGLIIGVAKELHLIPEEFNISPYSRIPDGISLMQLANVHMTPIPSALPLEAGNVIIVRFTKSPQHLGILGNYRHGGLSIIHASGSTGRVIETRLLFSPSMQLVSSLKLPGVE